MGTKLWERQPNETAKAYEAFCVYRDLGVSRSLEKTGKKLGKNLTTIGNWSSKNNWVERATTYDDHLEQIERQAIEKERIKEKRLRIKTLQAFRAKTVQAMDKLDPTSASWSDLTNALRMVSDQLRKEFDDEPTQRLEHSGAEDKPVVVKVVKGVSFDDL